MKLNKIFLSMAALVFVGAMTAGCSSDELTAETPQLPDTAGGTVVTKVTVSLDEHASTRALAANGTKTFAAGDKIAVIYKNTAGETMKAESAALNSFDILSSNSAKFSVTLTNPQANTPVRYIYPAAMAVAPIATDAAIDDASTIDYTKLATQDGTLTKLGSDFDLAVFDGTMTAQAVLPAAELKNPLTVGAFTIKNSGGTDITNTITKLTIADGTNTYTVSRTAADGPIYVAMKPMDNKTVTVSVTSNNNKYSDKSVSVTELAKNKIYPINVSLTARYPLAVTSTSVSSEDLGSVIGADGKIYLNATAATAATTTAVAIIAYLGSAGSVDESSSTYKGLAIALKEVTRYVEEWYPTSEGTCVSYSEYVNIAVGYKNGIACTNTLTTNNSGPCNGHTHAAASACRSHTPAAPTTYTSDWFLPSLGQWQLICQGLASKKAGSPVTTALTGDTNDTYKSTNLNSIIADAGGKELGNNGYWSSTEFGAGIAWAMNFQHGYAGHYGRATTYYVRAALAF